VNKLGTVINAMKPDGIGPKHPVSDYLECGDLDGKLQADYAAAGYKMGSN
jgi:hypothetical protein